MAKAALLIALLCEVTYLAVAPFSCPGSEQGCHTDQVCCNDDSKCYDIASAFDACKFSCTALTEDAANLPCFDSKSRENKCFGKTCSGNGDCFDGKCYCNIGFSGENCEHVAIARYPIFLVAKVLGERSIDSSPSPSLSGQGHATKTYDTVKGI